MMTSARVCSLFLCLAAASCSTLPAGSKYTLSKVGRDMRLYEPRLVLETEDQTDNLDKVDPTGNWGITLNGGFIPYLESVNRPEVVLFVRCLIRPNDDAEPSVLWESVHLDSEADGQNMVLNKRSYLPREDIPILPPIVYSGEDVIVQIRLIEIDSEDNARVNELISAASTAAATFQPVSAGAVTVVGTVLKALTSMNSDDIEFAYDFAVSTSSKPFTSTTIVDEADMPRDIDLVLQPRVGTYVVLKSEHRDRFDIPSTYVGTAIHGIRYGIAEVLRLGTLDIFNWMLRDGWCAVSDRKGTKRRDRPDLYRWLMGYPFDIDNDSTAEHTFDPQERYLTNANWQDTWFELVGSRIEYAWNPSKNSDGPHLTSPFRDQAFLVFSIVEADQGVDVAMLRQRAAEQDLIEGLALNTGQLSADAVRSAAGSVTDSLVAYSSEREARKGFLEATGGEQTPAEIARARDAALSELDQRLEDEELSDTERQALERAKQFVIARAEKLGAVVDGEFVLRWSRSQSGATELEIGADDLDGTISLAYRKLGDQYWSSLALGLITKTVLGHSARPDFTAINQLGTTGFEMLISEKKDGGRSRVERFWVGAEPALKSVSSVGTGATVIGADLAAGDRVDVDFDGAPTALGKLLLTDENGTVFELVVDFANRRATNEYTVDIQGVRQAQLELVKDPFYAGFDLDKLRL
ncbi:hypothetical protein [Engelhardtia mirabilis]|uniref:Uncharacterized protein n=1 Tax=Engelhardtia mirabilis TaxID=2528011 RepID=A0A518BDE5_9BACT|nr:hypothetical protein Pla133_00810 [Planctomycetes bacterium Pla133]QDU99344.1 hypothetical protein Pla86_00810 [Planctomycetes bacterium Pla86]